MHWHYEGRWLLKLMSLYCCSLSLYPAAATSRGYLAKLDLTAKVIILLDESRWLVGAAHSQVSPIYWECIIHWVYQGLTRSLKTGQTYYVLQIYDKYKMKIVKRWIWCLQKDASKMEPWNFLVLLHILTFWNRQSLFWNKDCSTSFLVDTTTQQIQIRKNNKLPSVQ